LGPLATAYFVELVVKMTDVQFDYDHIPMTIYNKPSIPDRTAYILGKSKESPLDAIVFWGKALAAQGADYIAIPCVTAHFFYEELSRAVEVPIINMVSETGDYLKENGMERIGLMATDGTIAGGFFQKGLESLGIHVEVPSPQGQEQLMNIIYGGIKANHAFSMDDFYGVAKELRDKGAQVIVLGCTELSLILRDNAIGPGFLDATAILARKSVLLCNNRLKKEFIHLIT